MSKRKGQTNGSRTRNKTSSAASGNAPEIDAAGAALSADSAALDTAPLVDGTNGVDGAAEGKGLSDGGRQELSGLEAGEGATPGADAKTADTSGEIVSGDIGDGSGSGPIENDGDASADGAADGGQDVPVSGEANDQAGSVGGGNPASGNDGREDDEGGEGAQSRLQRRNGRLYLRHDEKSGSLSSGNVAGISDDLKAALNRFGFTSVEAVASAYCHARVGESFLKAIEVIREHDGPFKDWAPANDPVEIIHDLYAALEHAREKAAAAPALDPEGSPASSEAPPEADSCPVCDVLFKPDDMCAIDIEMGTCHAECLDGTPVVDLDTGEPSSGPVLTFRYDDEKSELASASPLHSDALTDAIHDAAIFAGAYTPENFPASQLDPEFWRKCNPDDIIMHVADDAFRSVHANIEVIGAILTGGAPLEGSAFSYEAAKDLQDFIRKIGRRATPEILAQQLVITKHRQSAELTPAEHIGLKTFIAVLLDLDDYAAVEKKRLEDLAAEKPTPRPVPIEDTTMETVDDPMATH
ncbi:hypothetical protein [Agrobacterium sp. LMR679]|uniref:hypothetical protein n=1 Tax=Agrobacterium sp. LMR679 TaxID=3014335 RepID=UPI0022AFDFE2|nr:hypothetical protein [Agrobacterium sp. LMR679]MCZ4073558.1 hypothetical protein [Agrobacterium sp. LMR679]